MVNLRRRLAIVPALLALLLLTAACVGTVNPEGWSAPVFSGQDLYFLQSHNRVARAPIPTNNSTKLDWVFPDKNNSAEKDDSLQAVYGEPIVSNGVVYLTSYSGGVFALDANTGKPEWRVKDGISGNINGGAALGEGLIAFGSSDGHLYVRKASDGNPAPNWPADGLDVTDGIWAAPIIKGDTMYVATMGGNLYAYSLSKGPDKSLWPEPFHTSGGGAIAALSMLDDTHLFVPSIDGHVYVLDLSKSAETPHVQVDFKASDWVWTKAAFKDNIMYFGDFAGHIYAVDITKGPNGKMVWPAPATTDGNRVISGPTIVDNVLIVADRNPTVRFINLQDGKQLNAVPIDGAGTVRADLVAHDGFAYIVTTSGKLFAANPQNRSVTEVTVGGRQ